jgi:DNA polymerase III epsilon subunit family exonuclease
MTQAAEQSILDTPVSGTTVAVVDIETTGLHPGADRLIEVSVVRVEPGAAPSVALDTLVNPGRKVAATEIHGITDADVSDAPSFDDIAGDVARALSGAVVAGYNIYFDVRFLEDEFRRVKLRHTPPHICLMYLRPMLGLGRKCCLTDACRAHGIQHDEAHTAAFDAMAGAGLWHLYEDAMAKQGIRTFRDLTRLKRYKFLDSLGSPTLREWMIAFLSSNGHLKPRSALTMTDETRRRIARVQEYLDALMASVADLELSDAELSELGVKRAHLALSPDELRAVHGRVFASMLSEVLADSTITDVEWQRLRRLHACLQQLGWAPGM